MTGLTSIPLAYVTQFNLSAFLSYIFHKIKLVPGDYSLYSKTNRHPSQQVSVKS